VFYLDEQRLYELPFPLPFLRIQANSKLVQLAQSLRRHNLSCPPGTQTVLSPGPHNLSCTQGEAACPVPRGTQPVLSPGGTQPVLSPGEHTLSCPKGDTTCPVLRQTLQFMSCSKATLACPALINPGTHYLPSPPEQTTCPADKITQHSCKNT
jgi:hypothetical protein